MERRPSKPPNIPSRTSIHDWPAAANGKRFGDFEMDLIVDAYGLIILVLLERMTGFVMMERLPARKKARPLVKTAVRRLVAYHKYLNHYYQQRQRVRRSSCHNCRQLLFLVEWRSGKRQQANPSKHPKKSNFNEITDNYIKNVTKKHNLRPRNKLGFSNPKTEFFKQIANFALASWICPYCQICLGHKYKEKSIKLGFKPTDFDF